MTKFHKRLKLAAAPLAMLVLLVQLEGCYYMQAIRGQTELMSRRRPLAEVIADKDTPETLRRRLELVRDARDYAVKNLLLPDNKSYRTYADLDRDFVVWNVFAAPEFSLEPKTWCYPVAGCVAYRGYFKESAARKLGARLEADGYDVAIGGVSAYSTLGHFADPVLSTMLRWSDVDLVATIFHELAHQKLYVKNDSAFNESFATAVATIGVEHWLRSRNEGGELEAWTERRAVQKQMTELAVAAREKLSELYTSGIGDDPMRRRKRAILDRLSADAGALVAAHGNDVPNWLAAPLNNARLVSVNLYEGHVGAFNDMLAECKGQLECFYARAEALADLPAEERQRRLSAAAP